MAVSLLWLVAVARFGYCPTSPFLAATSLLGFSPLPGLVRCATTLSIGRCLRWKYIFLMRWCSVAIRAANVLARSAQSTRMAVPLSRFSDFNRAKLFALCASIGASK
ncbi:unnamed protein product [Arabis nemorensis]|uniref:Secreted protein n=1 Tax=Arabis nemorensis TaxID=586526 RepID=A0A565AMX9_9BRAS|nr:unnamed protein product [Arabis nemorensis]